MRKALFGVIGAIVLIVAGIYFLVSPPKILSLLDGVVGAGAGRSV